MTRHGEIDIRLDGRIDTYRLGMAEIEELEAAIDMSIFVAQGALAAELPFLRQKQWREIIRLGLVGGGKSRGEAEMRTVEMIEVYGPEQCAPIALRILGAALGKVYGDKPSGEQTAKSNQPASTSPQSTGMQS
ncbi:gene transfer agent family protein [Mesorhizobium sp. B2-1-3A]|uniref:gene transfer agent family protein n=1 Tax=Mesorhizobium sp. B2-1-3A TaxID=2589971 RepID=UPI0015E3B438|nr:gene transfer agent family protein [Mesorhizobium sp. B2-1-3A]